MAETCGPPVSHLILPRFTLEQLWVAHTSTDLGPNKGCTHSPKLAQRSALASSSGQFSWIQILLKNKSCVSVTF